MNRMMAAGPCTIAKPMRNSAIMSFVECAPPATTAYPTAAPTPVNISRVAHVLPIPSVYRGICHWAYNGTTIRIKAATIIITHSDIHFQA